MSGWAFLSSVELTSLLTADPSHEGLRNELVRRVTYGEAVLVSPTAAIRAKSATCRSCGATEDRVFYVKELKG
ncbi:hypothetical protein [Burkholderia phage BCSR129]|nr:hypothetical protein [Burkholderia phage BCSR129]